MTRETPDAPVDLAWFKSSYSSNEGGECVEVAHTPTSVFVRDSKAPNGPRLTVTRNRWVALLRGCSQR